MGSKGYGSDAGHIIGACLATVALDVRAGSVGVQSSDKRGRMQVGDGRQ